MEYDRIAEAARAIAGKTGRGSHAVAVVLGSGLSDYAGQLPAAVTMPYSEIPHFPTTAVEGHAGVAVSVELSGEGILFFAGRAHTYEGWGMEDIVFGVRVAALTGCHTVILTNAAGGIGDTLVPGDLVAIRDHLNMAARNPLMGINDDRLGPRFPDLSAVYDAEVRDLIRESAESAEVEYKEGVYAWLLGPSYETPAEIQMLRTLGADLVGMSTVPEAIALTHMGVRVGGISLVTNLAAGISPTPLSHAEVTEVAALARNKFTRLLDHLVPLLVMSQRDSGDPGQP